MKFLIPFISLSFILLLSSSCEEIDTFILDRSKVLESIGNDFAITHSYEYDDEERIDRVNYYSASSGDIIRYFQYEYDKDDVTIKLINASNDVVLQVEKIYNVDRKTLRRDIYGIDGATLTGYRLYKYNGNSCGYSEIEIYDANGIMQSRSTYAYYNKNCAEDIHSYNANNELLARIRIEKDDKQSYFESVYLDIFKIKGGNITSFTYMDADSVVIPNLSYYIDYQYNDFDEGSYPVVEYKYYNDGNFEDREFNYVSVQ